MTTVLEFHDVGMTLRHIPLFEAVSFRIEAGTTTGIRGPNASGKSVLMRLMCRMMVPTTGTVTIADRFLDHGRTFPDAFGIAIDGPAYLGLRSGYENLAELAGIRGRIGHDEIAAVMEEFGLDPESSTPVRRYSMGMKQKLSLCQAVMEDPEVLILDEPFNALDAASVTRLHGTLEELREREKTVILTSHNADDIDRHASSSLWIDDRRIERR